MSEKGKMEHTTGRTRYTVNQVGLQREHQGRCAVQRAHEMVHGAIQLLPDLFITLSIRLINLDVVEDHFDDVNVKVAQHGQRVIGLLNGVIIILSGESRRQRFCTETANRLESGPRIEAQTTKSGVYQRDDA